MKSSAWCYYKFIIIIILLLLSVGNQCCQCCYSNYCCSCFHRIIRTTVIVVYGAYYRSWARHWRWAWSRSSYLCYRLWSSCRSVVPVLLVNGLYRACLRELVAPVVPLGRNLEILPVVHPVFYSGLCKIPVVVLCHHLCRNEQHAHHHCENHHFFHNCKFLMVSFFCLNVVVSISVCQFTINATSAARPTTATAAFTGFTSFTTFT